MFEEYPARASLTCSPRVRAQLALLEDEYLQRIPGSADVVEVYDGKDAVDVAPGSTQDALSADDKRTRVSTVPVPVGTA